MKVLLVEDEESIRQALKDEFSKERITIVEAHNGQEGIDLALKERPDCILLDVIMPRMHGIDMLVQLQTTEAGKSIPVVLLTNYADDPKVIQAIKEGRCTLLEKSKVTLKAVVQHAQQVVKNKTAVGNRQ